MHEVGYFEQENELDEYVDSVVDYINFCLESCLQTKVISQYPNNKPWFNK